MHVWDNLTAEAWTTKGNCGRREEGWIRFSFVHGCCCPSTSTTTRVEAHVRSNTTPLRSRSFDREKKRALQKWGQVANVMYVSSNVFRL